ncbi:hypothetical protein GCM10007416_33760 [Kroppenstedtia guangzhouensis]|uniref:Uncharacterized protein n=1 Tax=Kroppenstedtia guangzhouensis TaxID=1274356 RepID=A0ABQ1H3T5_9BACL|nr:hypothetical protein GCM10007416_33760 [Kroppenstedtia guangzhouensis]
MDLGHRLSKGMRTDRTKKGKLYAKTYLRNKKPGFLYAKGPVFLRGGVGIGKTSPMPLIAFFKSLFEYHGYPRCTYVPEIVRHNWDDLK